ncbi:WW domain binding protein 2 [Dermatophagoides farinae]|uniref:WW domain binding protein 2 n=1 Tax=Dermatophagoides farinae TaxID=6954 RepID=A0A922HX06_DERFA|nr:WW domain binding protein 2 [Dermatophagoides farinae]
MSMFNNSHHESGGVVLFNGELILLFCENVNIQVVERNHNETGKLYLTTHRMIFTNRSMSNSMKSLSIPFYTLHDLSLEQPIFGANYIKGKSSEAGNNSKFTFKLKFTSGGATEYGQALLNAAKSVRNFQQSNAFQPPPAYSNPAGQYYQAPPNVYQPAYNCGFALPNDIFNQPPPAGFIYTSEAPPPYPGLNTHEMQKSAYPTQPPPPQQQQFGSGQPPQMGFGGFQQPLNSGGGYPQQPAFAPQIPPPAYPGSQNGYPSGGQIPQPPTNPMYPNLNDLKPSAPPS